MKRSPSVRPGFAVDIDNVLANAEPEIQRIFQELTGQPWPQHIYASAGGLDGHACDQHLIEQIFDYFHNFSIPTLPVEPGGREALEGLHRDYRIVIITARRPDSRPQTLEWLQRHHIPFDELHHSGDKTDVAEHITLAVDDHPEHAQDYSNQGIPVFLMDQPWNQQFSAPLVTRVHGWEALITCVHQQRPSQDLRLTS